MDSIPSDSAVGGAPAKAVATIATVGSRVATSWASASVGASDGEAEVRANRKIVRAASDATTPEWTLFIADIIGGAMPIIDVCD
jgi:hypothetical protein